MSGAPAVVDSSGWIEVFTDGPQANRFLAVLEHDERLVLSDHSEAQAIQAVAAMQRGKVVDLDSRLAMAAAQLSHTLRLPMADSIILATARSLKARLYTMDADFRGLKDVEYIQKL